MIHSIVPSRAMRCEVVKITGCGFGSFQYQQRLTFNGRDVTGTTIGNWSDTELLVPVPKDGTSGPVIVTNPRGEPSAGVSFEVVDDEPVWEKLPSIGQANSGVRVELKLRSIPVDPEGTPRIVPVAWTQEPTGAVGDITWRTEREFDVDFVGFHQHGATSHWEIKGQVWPDQRAVALEYREDRTRVTESSRGELRICELEAELAIVLPLVDAHESGTPAWNEWAPRFPFRLYGSEVSDLITKITYRDTCHIANLAGERIGPAESFVLDHLDETGYWFGHSAHSVGLTLEGSGSDPCSGPKPPWELLTDLVGDAYVMLPGVRWDPMAVFRADVSRLLVGTAEGYRQPLPGLPVALLHTPPGASQSVEIGRTVTDHDGRYRFWNVPITDSLRLDLRLENHETSPPAFVVTYDRAQGDAVQPVTLRTTDFATTATWPNRRNTEFKGGAGTSSVPFAQIADAAAVYAHSWQAWRAAAELSLPLDMRSAAGAPPEIRAFSPEKGVYWDGDNMIGPQYGHLPGDPGEPLVNIEAASSLLSSFDRPVNREFHELGHHIMADLFDNTMPSYWVSNAVSDTNHLGTLNPTTSDSWVEGFAEYFAAVVSQRSRTTRRPELYPVSPQTVLNLDHNYKARSHWGAAPYQSVEEFAVASLLWDLADSHNDENDLTPLGVNQSLLDHWQVQPGDPLAQSHWPPDVYGDRIALGHANLLRLIRDSDEISRKHGIRAPNAPSGYDYVWDVKHLYDLLRAEGIGGAVTATSPHGLSALDELFVAHGFFADTSPQNLVYDPREAIGMTSNRAYSIIGTSIPARAARYSPAPPPTGYLTYSGRDADTGAPVVISSFVVDIQFDHPHSHLTYSYRAPAGSNDQLQIALPEPLYSAQISVAAYGKDRESTSPFELSADDYWYRAARSSDGEIAVATFDMQTIPSRLYLPALSRYARVSDLTRASKAVPPPPPSSAALVSDLVSLINAERVASGRAPLLPNDSLRDAAEWYAGDMAASGAYRPDHTDRLGRSMGDRLKAFGYVPEGHPRWHVAENIARGQAKPAAVVAAWMASPPHRANILNDGLCEIGAAHGYAPADSYRHYWVADFGCRAEDDSAVPPATTPSTPQPGVSPTPTTTRSPVEPPPTATGSPTPTATVEAGLGIQGCVTSNGSAAPDVMLVLRL